MSKKLTLITLACLALALTSPVTAQGKKKGGNSGGTNSTSISKGIYTFLIDGVDANARTISVKINDVPSNVILHPALKIFLGSGGNTVTLDYFASHAVGKPFRVSLTGVKDGYTCDQIWDGVAFTDYRSKAASVIGRILDMDVDYLRVENFVFRLNKETKYHRNGKDKRANPFTEGMRVTVRSTPSNANDQTPIATQVSDTDVKPLGQGVKDSIKNSEKKVSGRAKDQLKSGVKPPTRPSGTRPTVKPKGTGKGKGGAPKVGGGQ